MDILAFYRTVDLAKFGNFEVKQFWTRLIRDNVDMEPLGKLLFGKTLLFFST